MKKKHILILFSIFLLSKEAFAQFSKFGLQTSDILELNKGSNKHKAIFANEKIIVHENYKTTKDTIYYKITSGEFILFEHDSVKSSDSLVMTAGQIQEYYVLTKDKSIKLENPKFVDDKNPIKIYYYSITKIIRGRKTYKMRATMQNEKVWE